MSRNSPPNTPPFPPPPRRVGIKLPAMFADATLAARIDEPRRVCARLVMASPVHSTGGPFVLPLDGGLALFAGPRLP